MYKVEIIDSETNCKLEVIGPFNTEAEADVAANSYIDSLPSEEEKFYTEYDIVELI